MALLVGLVFGGSARVGLGAGREIVIANENLAGAGAHLPANLQRFLRRIEVVAGWPRGSLRGKALLRPAEALAYIRKNRSAFAILPAHQVAQGRTALGFELLGRAVGLEGLELYWAGVARNPKGFARLGDDPRIRVAGSELADPAWLAHISDQNITPEQPATLVPVASSTAALEALLARKADVALLSETKWKEIEKRADPGGDLEFVFASPRLPPSAVVAVGKHARPAERKQLADALARVCKEEGGEACARMGILYIQPGETAAHERLFLTYEALRQQIK